MHNVTEDQNRRIGRMMQEIKSLIDLRGGSPLDPERVADGLQRIIEEKGPDEDPAISVMLADWKRFYHDLFGLEINLFALTVPRRRKAFGRLIVVAEEMTFQNLYGKYSELFSCGKCCHYDDLGIGLSERTAEDGAYAVWVKDTIEADENLEYLSADQLKERRIPSVTLGERLLMELKYFKETGNHLDVARTTLCAGSRYPNGTVPGVGWNPTHQTLYIDWHSSNDSRFGLCSRRVAL